MNDKRRRFIKRGVELIMDGKSIIDTALEEEQECFDNLPEGIQCSDKGSEMEDAIDALQTASDDIDDALGYLEDLV